jgi:solute carrier family 25 S-adenosylmethionine transporter 26
VDVSLFPLDTLKTRLQAPAGFWKSGGVTGIYRGLGSAAVGSVPGAALFFGTYETVKPIVGQYVGKDTPASHMIAASVGEVAACLARVPTENVKQNLQAGTYPTTGACVRAIMAESGMIGFMKGYASTVMREIPFSMIQFPIWEYLKVELGKRHEDGKATAFEAASAGSASGAFAAAVTTPLDVIKTRLMLRVDVNGVKYTGMVDTAQRILSQEGPGALLSGIGPRTMWIGIGGFVYFGVYSKGRELLSKQD